VKSFLTNPNRALLLIVFITLSTSTLLWVRNDQTPPPWDPSDHISTAYDYYRYIAHADLQGFYKEFFLETHYYAPFVHLMTAIIFLIFGASKTSAIFINLISLAAILIATLLIYQKTFTNPDEQQQGKISPGILAGILASCYHFPAWLIHDAFLDYPLIAIVTVSFALLLKTDNFTNRNYSMAFGVAFATGLLTKQTFAFFLILPVIYAMYKAVMARRFSALFNLFLAILISAILAAIWYAPHLNDVLEIYRINKEGAINENEAPLFSFMSNVFYIHALISAQLQLPFAALFIFGLIFSLVRFRKECIPVYLWLLSGLGIFTMIANKDVRYTVPILPAVAIISVCWLSQKSNASASPKSQNIGSTTLSKILKTGRLFRIPAIVAIILLSLTTLYTAQWPQPGTGYYIDTPNFRWMVFARNYYGFDHRPLADDWGVPKIVSTIATDYPTRNSGEEPILGVAVNLPYLNPSAFTLYSRLQAPGKAGPPLLKIDALVSDTARERFKNCQYLIIRTGLEHAEWKAPLETYAEEFLKQAASNYTKALSLPIPLQNAEVVLYRRNDVKTLIPTTILE
jgi:4-amino-4-deoxy-L-arabinose transferase-like glycosyltransferase